MPEYNKDIVLAVLGASVGLAGLLLVVSGFALAQVGGLGVMADDKDIATHEKAAKWGIVPFLLSLADAAVCLWWLLNPSQCLFCTGVAGFFLLLVLTAVYGSVLFLRYL